MFLPVQQPTEIHIWLSFVCSSHHKPTFVVTVVSIRGFSGSDPAPSDLFTSPLLPITCLHSAPVPPHVLQAVEPRGNRYQCGPLSLDFGGTHGGTLGDSGMATGAGGAVLSAGGRVRSRANTGGRRHQLAVCFPGNDDG